MNSYCCKEYYNTNKKGDYCFYCIIIYRDFKGNETNNDDKSWLSQLSNNINIFFQFVELKIKIRKEIKNLNLKV